MKFQYEQNHQIGCLPKTELLNKWMNALRPLMLSRCVERFHLILHTFRKHASNDIDLLEPFLFFFSERRLNSSKTEKMLIIWFDLASNPFAAHSTSKSEERKIQILNKLDQNLFRARWAISCTEMPLPCLHFQPKTRNLISKETKRERNDDMAVVAAQWWRREQVQPSKSVIHTDFVLVASSCEWKIECSRRLQFRCTNAPRSVDGRDFVKWKERDRRIDTACGLKINSTISLEMSIYS